MSDMTLQWLTPDALMRAWIHVHENGGCAGADGVTLDRFARNLDAELDMLRTRVESGRYVALPLLPIVVRKKPGFPATRTLLVPAVRDRVLQTAAGHCLGRAFEDEFLECSFAYRPHRSVNSAIARIRFLHEHGFTFIAEADIPRGGCRADSTRFRRIHRRARAGHQGEDRVSHSHAAQGPPHAIAHSAARGAHSPSLRSNLPSLPFCGRDRSGRPGTRPLQMPPCWASL
jgi:hypothetical protein